MKVRFTLLYLTMVIVGLTTVSFNSYGQESNVQMKVEKLPIIKILGEPYYYYEVGKNESIYAISKSLGWDMEVVNRVNPNLGSPLERGSVIYYPVSESKTDTADINVSISQQSGGTARTINHVVKKGENVYSIGKMYNVTTDAIYSMNPNSQHGIKAGETLKIDVGNPLSHPEGGYIYHTVEKGETLYGLSKKYNSSVADILQTNPGLIEDKLPAGITIRIVPDSKKNRLVTEKVERQKVISVTNYRVKKNDNWMKIAKATGVNVELLKAANPEVAILEKGQVLAIPRTEKVIEEQVVQQEAPRDATEEGRQQIYQEVHELDNIASTNNVRIAVVFEDYTTNKDMEFARGLLVAVNKLRNSSFKTNLSMIDGKVPVDSIIGQLEVFEPNLIITTHDKNYPVEIADFAHQNGIAVVNVFDVKNEDYISNPSLIQLLTPSQFFNTEVAKDIADRFSDKVLVIPGVPDGEDTMLDAIKNEYPTPPLYLSSISEIENFETYPGEEYVFYGCQSKKEDVKNFLDMLETLRTKSPEADICVIGRPNWITYAELLQDKFKSAVVYIPSRFYFDSDALSSRRFLSDFKEMYGRTPIKSYPVYAVTGYDVGEFFINGMAKTNGDLNAEWPDTDALQTDFGLKRSNSWGGIYNPVVYLIKFNQFGDIDKITIGK